MAPKIGTQFGCTDTTPPERNTHTHLSRVYDLLKAAEAVGGQTLKVKVFNLLDNATKTEFNYSNWKYS